jgi:single-stranded DNA-specific DHH superfamily exonuclease
MAKYQRPCCILTEAEEYSGQTMTGYRYETSYSGSARGCALAGIDDFKQLCLDSGCVEYAVGHPNAFGLKIYKRDLQKFIDYMNEQLKDMSDEAIYYVDYIFKGQDVDGSVILTIADMDDYWGTELDEALVAIEGLKVTASMVDVYRKATNTIKISLNNGISIMKFNADEELCDKLTTNNTGYMKMDIIGKCNKNEYNGVASPQIYIEDYNITDSNKYYF